MKSTNKLMLGVNKKRSVMKKSKKRLIQKVADYLRSDCYMYAPVVSSLPFGSGQQRDYLSTQGFGVAECGGEKDKSFVEKVGEYIKSDCYMYAPVADSLFTTLPTNPADSEKSRSTVTLADSNEKLAIQKPDGTQPVCKTVEERPAGKDSPIKQRVERKEMAKRVVYQNCRPSTRSGRG